MKYSAAFHQFKIHIIDIKKKICYAYLKKGGQVYAYITETIFIPYNTRIINHLTYMSVCLHI